MANDKKEHSKKKGRITFAITNKHIENFQLKCKLKGIKKSEVIENAMIKFINE